MPPSLSPFHTGVNLSDLLKDMKVTKKKKAKKSDPMVVDQVEKSVVQRKNAIGAAALQVGEIEKKTDEVSVPAPSPRPSLEHTKRSCKTSVVCLLSLISSSVPLPQFS